MYHLEDCTEGRVWIGGSHTLTEAEIIAFASVWDPQVFHVDPEAAKHTAHGGLIASSVHLYAIAAKLLNEIPFNGIASLRHEMSILNPGRPGDTLTLAVTCMASRRSASKPDRGLLDMLMTLTNQHGQVVLSTASTVMLHTRHLIP
jgi:acyl dehydratase